MCEQSLHCSEEALLSCGQQMCHTFLHMPVAGEHDGLQECQHLPHNFIIGVREQGNHLGEVGCKNKVLCSVHQRFSGSGL